MSALNIDVANLRTQGWITLSSEDPSVGRIFALKQACAEEFLRLLGEDVLSDVPAIRSGQEGFSEDGNEATGSMPQEYRAHLAVNQWLPEGHPFSILQPPFYGTRPSAADDPLGPLLGLAQSLMTELDRLTLGVFEQIDRMRGDSSRSLTQALICGERLLRFQYYPPFGPVEELSKFTVDINGLEMPIVGVSKKTGSGPRGARLVRANPHADIGHWTWQLHATAKGLRFWDQQQRRVTVCDPGDTIIGNVCEYLALAVPELVAPIHWVDVDVETVNQGRLSISYFAHVRPLTYLNGELAGLRLIKDLLRLGYDAQSAWEEAIALTTQYSDAALARAAEEWESRHGTPPGFWAGFTPR